MSKPAIQRVGPLRHVQSVLESQGMPSPRTLAILEPHAEQLRDPDNFLPFAAAADLLDRSAAALNCPHFGLLVGERADQRDLGVPGVLMASAATVGHALMDFTTCQIRNSNGASVYLAKVQRSALLGYGIYDRNIVGGQQVYDLAVAVGVNILKRLGGSSARPSEVLLSHRAVRDRQPYFRILGPATRFDQPQTALVIPPAVLSLPIGTRDDLRHAQVLQEVRKFIDQHYPDFHSRVQHMIRASLLMGTDTAKEIARKLDIHVRTLNRRLREEQTSFRELSQQVRFSVACELLDITDLKIADIAAALSYATPAAFVHAFQRWTGMAPSDWRARRVMAETLAEAG